MKLNRKWIMVIALVLSMTMAVSGTLAYLTDKDEKVNTFTMGNVDIELVEKNFVDGSALTPGVAVDKLAEIQNIHPTSDAYVWMIVSVPESMKEFIELEWKDGYEAEEVDSPHEDYVGYLVKYDGVLEAPDGTTGDMLTGVKLNANVDYQIPDGGTAPQWVIKKDGKLTSIPVPTLEDTAEPGLHIIVDAYAIQTEGFKDVHEAYEAYVTQWKVGTPIDSMEALNDVFENEEKNTEPVTVFLTENIIVDNMMKLENGADVTLDLNGKTIEFEPSADFKAGNPIFYPLAGTKLTITGNGTIDFGDNYDAALVYPAGEVVIENGTFIRDRVPEGVSADDVQTLFVGVKSVGSSLVINGGYFDSGYYDQNVELAFSETDADIANRGKSTDKNLIRTAIKNNTTIAFNLSWSSDAGTQDFRIYGGTFVGASPAWGDEGCAMPITPDYLRPWSYYQGMFLEGQVMHDDKIEIPDGYTITEGTTDDGRPTYTVNYNK